jgi:hypothetical protein
MPSEGPSLSLKASRPGALPSADLGDAKSHRRPYASTDDLGVVRPDDGPS